MISTKSFRASECFLFTCSGLKVQNDVTINLHLTEKIGRDYVRLLKLQVMMKLSGPEKRIAFNFTARHIFFHHEH